MEILLVPLHAEALALETARRTLGPLARFDRLPWAGQTTLHNSDAPWLGPSLEEAPFTEPNATLEKGVHLHWALPDGLTRGKAGRDFPAAPDRWHVRRAATATTPSAEWVVESDWQEPSDTIGPQRTLFPRFGVEGRPPWQAQGRCLAFADWLAAQGGPRARVTALGYGDPLFAAYYPSARGLFGLHDPDAPVAAGQSLVYDILGWHSDASEDPLAAAALTLDELRRRFFWEIPGGKLSDAAPRRLALYGRISIAVAGVTQSPATPLIGLAHTGVEALAALSAVGASSADAAEYETAAAIVSHLSKLGHLTADHAPILASEVHEQGFLSEPGGVRWALRRRVADNAPAQADAADLRADELPTTLGEALDEVNARQSVCDRRQRELRTRRGQLLADWSKMMMALYPATPDDVAPCDPAEMQNFIRRYGVDPIAALEAEIGSPSATANADGDMNIAPGALSDTCQGRLALAAAPLLAKLDVFNAMGLSGRRTRPLALGPELGGKPNLAFADAGDALVLDAIEGWSGEPHLGDGPYLRAVTIWLSVWVDTPVEAPILSFGADQHLALSLKMLNGRPLIVFSLRDPGGGLHELTSSAPLATGAWVDVAAVFDTGGGLQQLWFGDASVGAQTVSSLPWIGSRTRRWGVLGAGSTGEEFGPQAVDGSAFFNGAVSRLVMIPNRALTGKDLAELRGRKRPPPIALAKEAAARFWRPRDPVVMIKGEAAGKTRRHSRGVLTCHRRDASALDDLTGPDRPTQAKALTYLSGEIDQILTNPGDMGASRSQGARWDPLYIEWQATLHSYLPDVTDPDVEYAPDCLTKLFDLDPDGPDLTRKGPALASVAAPTVATGRAILTPFADDLMAARCDRARENGQIDLSSLPQPALRRQRDTQSQALGGFHAALIQQRQALTLPPDDPHAIDGDQSGRSRAFSRDIVAKAISPANGEAKAALSAATPNGPFMPLRAGWMEMRRLRVVDAFGQTLDIPVGDIARPLALQDESPLPAPAARVMLPPRLSQPARLNIRWLSARSGVEESNGLSDSSPICGWIVANRLDEAFAFYDADGAALGEATADADHAWRAAPGATATPPEGFASPVLGRLARMLCRQGPDRRQALLGAIPEALETILPQISGVTPSLALAAGRPLAVARVRIGFEWRDGGPAINQSWGAFAQDLRRAGAPGVARHDAGLGKVRVAVRLGDKSRLDDGLVGFWREDEAGMPIGPLHMPALASGATTAGGVVGFADAGFLLELPLGGPPETLTLLFDPFGKIHATSGVLPVKAISTPPEFFLSALSALESWFLAAPMLTPRGKIEAPLPSIEGRSWAWRERVDDGWRNLPSAALRPPREDAAFDGPAELREGWLILTRDETR